MSKNREMWGRERVQRVADNDLIRSQGLTRQVMLRIAADWALGMDTAALALRHRLDAAVIDAVVRRHAGLDRTRVSIEPASPTTDRTDDAAPTPAPSDTTSSILTCSEA